ncbi:phenylacetaldehyde reductase isoform X3 [Setaria viridis]|uniref:phenylacetaldehyde reductase isoform X3 n=1 Tax=Setaria viridis TaxID=4556 RepID=UPI001493722C|nr:tetraketide alpha-pyrone reductase 1-like isoform X3 [Setaria viridis]
MANGEGKGETVVVTGASGFIGSTLVRRLLDRGYNVHAGVLNPDDKAETDHLLALAAGAGEGRLRIFRCDLLDRAAILDAARGCSGVFHLASPCTIDPVSDPQKQLIVPAVEGTLNVLRAAKEAGGVRRVVLTSSNSAIMPSPGWPAGEVPDERCWTDIDYCEKNGLWYSVSKTLAEKAAWKFAEENGVDVAVVNPGAVMGPIIPPTINSSMSILLRLLQDLSLADWWMTVRKRVDKVARKSFDSMLILTSWSIWLEHNARTFNRRENNDAAGTQDF